MKKGEGRKNWEQKTERGEQIHFKSQVTENYVMTEQREFVLKNWDYLALFQKYNKVSIQFI